MVGVGVAVLSPVVSGDAPSDASRLGLYYYLISSKM
jgi:hypothetical protein